MNKHTSYPIYIANPVIWFIFAMYVVVTLRGPSSPLSQIRLCAWPHTPTSNLNHGPCHHGNKQTYGTADETYLVRGGADAEDEPRGEVGPGDRARGSRRPDAELGRSDGGGQEEEKRSTAERLSPHHVRVQRAARPQLAGLVSPLLSSVRRPAALAGGAFYI